MASVTRRYSSRLARLFADADQAVALRLSEAKLAAAGVGGLSNSRFAFVGLDAIEQGILPAIYEGLVAYDLATNRPFPPRLKLERTLRDCINTSFDKGIQRLNVGGGAFKDPWRPVLEANAPAKLAELLGLVDQHLTGLTQGGARPAFKPWWERDLLVRLASLFVGGVIGALGKTLVDRLLP